MKFRHNMAPPRPTCVSESEHQLMNYFSKNAFLIGRQQNFNELKLHSFSGPHFWITDEIWFQVFWAWNTFYLKTVTRVALAQNSLTLTFCSPSPSHSFIESELFLNLNHVSLQSDLKNHHSWDGSNRVAATCHLIIGKKSLHVKSKL